MVFELNIWHCYKVVCLVVAHCEEVEGLEVKPLGPMALKILPKFFPMEKHLQQQMCDPNPLQLHQELA